MNFFSITFKRALPVFVLLSCLFCTVQLAAKPESNTPNAFEFNNAPPNWSVNPDDYEFSMNMVIRVSNQGVANNAPNNKIGVFVGNQVRGVAVPTLINGSAYYFITIYSNVYFGENLNFRVYYAPDDTVYPVLETETFVHNKSIGSAQTPFWIDIDPDADFPPVLLPIPADTTLQTIPFAPINLNDYLVSLDGDPVVISVLPSANLNVTLVNGLLSVSPVLGSWIGTDSVRIIAKESTPNQLADTVFARFTVLADYGPPVFQNIPNQTIFPGQNFTPIDLDNYLTFNGNCRQFDFKTFPFTGAVADPAWPVVAPGPQPMQIVVRPLFAEMQLAGPGAKLAAFVNGVLAGWAVPTGVAPNVHYALQLSNVGSGAITFRFYDAARQFLYEKTSNLNFVAGGSAGSVAAPYSLQLSPLVPSLNAAGVVQVGIQDPNWLGTFPVRVLVWDCLFPQLRRDSATVLFSVVSDVRPEITSPAAVSFEENACSVLYDTQTSDPNNSESAGLSYSIAGGADANRFTINAITGVLNWANGFTPNFENPADANQNNQYLVQIRVVNLAGLSDTLALTVTITNQPNEPFVASINGGIALVCTTTAVTLEANGGVSYQWSNGSAQSSILVVTPGIYTVTATSSGACTATVSVTVAPPPTITAAGNTAIVCLGTPIQLTSTPSGGFLPYTTFAWSGPNNYTATQEDPSAFPATANAAGAYIVTVTDNNGCTASATTTIQVSSNSAPTVTASSNTPVCEGASIALSANPVGGTGNGYQFQWAGPNNYIGVGQNPLVFTATLANNGNYTVTVTDNAGCSGTGNTNVVVNAKPAIVAGSNSPVSVGANILLNSTTSGGSGSGYGYTWSGPNNYAANQAQPQGFLATLAAAGAYKVTVSDTNGCTNTSSTTVAVISCPTISASVTGSTCIGGNITLTSSPTGGALPYTAFAWSGPNNYTANVEDPAAFQASNNASGIYTVTVTDQLGCTATASVTVNVLSGPSITAANNGPLCQNAIAILTSTPNGGSGGNTFVWTGPDNFGASNEDPAPFTAGVAASGVYQVKVTDNQGCSATATTNLVVYSKPNITASVNTPVCFGANINLQSTTTGGSGVYSSFNWTGPSSYTSTQEDPASFVSNSLGQAGTYRVTVTDNAGCVGTSSTTLSVSSNAAPSITATSNSPICAGNNLVLTSIPNGGTGNYISFSWAGPNNFTASQEDPTPFLAFGNANGVYSVTVTDNNNCKGTTTISVTVSAPPVNPSSNSPVCIGGTLNLFAGGTGQSYSWTGPNNFSSIAENPVISPATAAASGTYMVSVTNNGCVGTGSVTVLVGDVIPPTVTCPASLTIFTGNNNCNTPLPAFQGASSSDNCVVSSFTQTPLPGFVVSGHNTVQVVTYLATDAAGNTASCTTTVTLKDNIVPEITCPPNTTITANANCSGVVGAFSPVTISDNCTANPTVQQSPAAATVITLNTSQVVTLTTDDGNGNTNFCTFEVVLKDLTPPSITCPANVTLTADGNCSGIVGAYSAVTVSDNCNANPTVTQNPVSSTVLNGHNDLETVVLTADDGNGNTTSCSLTVILRDITKPVITCPANTTIAADGNCSGVVGSYAPLTLSDNCTVNPAVTQSPAASTVLSGHNDVETVTLTADDGNGNTQSCSLSVTLKDVTKPVITCPANTTIAANANCSGVVGAYTPITLSDNCAANPSVTQSPIASTVLSGHNDVEVVTLTANDGNGNTQSCSLTVTLKDVTKPLITCPANTTIAADGNCSGIVGAYAPLTLSDNCTANPVVTQSPAASTVLSGHNDVETVTLTADDGNGNTQFCTFTVTLKDITKPIISCPANVTLNADANCTAPVGAYQAVLVSDNCSANPTVTQSPVASTLLSGHDDVEVVILTANDGNGNTQSCSLTVTLKDVTKPVITCPANTTIAANATCSNTLGAYQPVTLSDNCTANPVVTQSPAASTVLSGHNDVETVTLTANDGNGNTQFCTFTVTLKDITPPVVVCKPFSTYLNTTGSSVIVTADVFQSGSDNCGTVNQVSVVPNIFTCGQVGPNTVTLTVNDGNGNNSTCTAIVTVLDTIKPTMICQNATLNLNANGESTLTVAQVNNGSFDNCSIAAFTLSQTLFTCSNLGANLVTLTGQDPSGNTSVCSAIVTVFDFILPVAKCKNITASLGPNGMITVNPALVDDGSTDNCSMTFTITPGTFTCANIGVNVVTFRATDAAGNTATCTARVSIKDATAPTALCKSATVFLGANGQGTLTVAQVNNGSFDNCGIVSTTLSQTLFDCSNISSSGQTVVMTLKDASNNTSSCLALVLVKDAMAPVAKCKQVTVKLSANGTVSVTGASLASNSYDNCAVWSFTPVAKVYTTANIGVNNLPITVKDFSGNSATCTAVVTVEPFSVAQPVEQRDETEDSSLDAFLNIFPNPNAGQANIAFKLPVEQQYVLRIFDLTGRLMLEQADLGIAGENTLLLDMHAFSDGLYFVQFISGKIKNQVQMVVQH